MENMEGCFEKSCRDACSLIQTRQGSNERPDCGEVMLHCDFFVKMFESQTTCEVLFDTQEGFKQDFSP